MPGKHSYIIRTDLLWFSHSITTVHEGCVVLCLGRAAKARVVHVGWRRDKSLSVPTPSVQCQIRQGHAKTHPE